MDVRRHTIELLATPRGETRFGSSYLPALIVTCSGCRPTEAHAALWGLVAEGLVYLDPSGHSGSDNWHWRLSELGLLAAGGGTWEPRDADGFLRRLRKQAPDVDPDALVYIDESLRAFNARCYLSSSVMLGVAAEHHRPRPCGRRRGRQPRHEARRRTRQSPQLAERAVRRAA